MTILPRFVPLQRFPNHIEPHISESTHGLGYVATSGFRTLSPLCSPCDLPGLFHPGSTLGVHPSRPCSSCCAVCPLGHRGLLEVFTGINSLLRAISHPARPFKAQHAAESSTAGSRLVELRTAIASLSLDPSRFLVRPDRRPLLIVAPLSCFFDSVAS
jgi:hypothetical protein